MNNICRLFLVCLSACLLTATPALSHIGKGPMPDVVAAMEYRILLDFQPEKNDIRNKLGMVLYRRDKLKQAEKEFRTVLKNDPQNFNATDALGLVYMKQNDLLKAESQFNAALALKSDDVWIYFHLGEIYVSTERYPEALEMFTTSLQMAEKMKITGETAPDLELVKQAMQDVQKKISSASGEPAVH